MNKKISLGAAIAFALIIAAAVFSITMVYSQNQYNKTISSLQKRESMQRKISEVEQEVRLSYYGAGAINESKLQASIIQGYLKGIDDEYAKYYTKEEYSRIERQQSSSATVGIGIETEPSAEGYLEVLSVYPESPAQIVRIEEGSLIISIDDVGITYENNEEMLSKISGQSGTKVSMVVRKGGVDTPVEMTRAEVAVPTVHTKLIGGSIGYIRFTDFDKDTSNQFNKEFKRLEESGAKALIFDLRGVKSQKVEYATRIIDRIVSEGIIARVMDKEGNVTPLDDLSDANEIKMSMVTITNKETSGVGELFVQVLKDYNKAKSVGTATAGRGVRQEIIKLSDGSAIEITTALYQSPKGVVYNKVGVLPDYDVSLPQGITDWTTLDSSEDPQFLKAVELIATDLKGQGIELVSDTSEVSSSSAPDVSTSQAESSESSDDSSKDESSSESSSDGSSSDTSSEGSSSEGSTGSSEGAGSSSSSSSSSGSSSESTS